MAEPAFTELAATADRIRQRLRRLHSTTGRPYLDQNLACVEILTYLHGHWLRPTDRLLLGLGIAGPAWYTTLWAFGQFSERQLQTLGHDGTTLAWQPAPRNHPALTAATGTPGHSLPVAVGLAYAQRQLRGAEGRVVCLLGTGDGQIGTLYEAAHWAGRRGLSNLRVLATADAGSNAAPWWQLAGFAVREVAAHDLAGLHTALNVEIDRPSCVLYHPGREGSGDA